MGPTSAPARPTLNTSAMARFNLDSAEVTYDEGDPPGYATGYRRFGPEIGATKLGGTIYELPEGQSICPYHYEYGNEEWLIVLDGSPILRHPDGEDALEPGDVVCFPAGPTGAHKVTNTGKDATIRVLFFSTVFEPSVAVYPDSDKIGVWPGSKSDTVMLRRRDGRVGYWEDER